MDIGILLILVLQLVILPFSNAQTSTGTDYALLIAAENYQEWESLDGPVETVERMAEILKNKYGFETELLLHPDQQQLLQRLQAYVLKRYQPNDQLFIFMVGHGAYQPLTSEGFFIPVDGRAHDPTQASWVSHARLEHLVDHITCPHIFLAIDGAYSGTFETPLQIRQGKGRPGDTDPGQVEAFIAENLVYQSRLFLVSGEKQYRPGSGKVSAFSQTLLETLEGGGGADRLLTIEELQQPFELLSPIVRAGFFGQHQPGGTFFFREQ